MKIIIHKGSHEIGGSCLQISTATTKLWIDFGMPLDENIPEMYEPKPDAILITHSHLDHYGLIEKLSDVPVYIGNVSKNLIEALKLFTDKGKPLNDRFKLFEAGEKIQIGDLTIKAYLNDHSSPEAFSFHISDGNKSIFITGDFRNSGYKKKVFDYVCNNAPKNVDVLFVEGTNIEREYLKYADETSIEEALVPIFQKQENHSIVIGSGQNIDRIVAVYRACKRTDKILVINPYIALMLKIVNEKSKKIPQWNWTDIGIFDKGARYRKLLEGTEYEGFAKELESNLLDNNIFKNPSKYVTYSNKLKKEFPLHLIKEHNKKVNLIYSMWSGYLEKENLSKTSKDILELKANSMVDFDIIHTSGHATKENILELVSALKPKKTIPVHTDNPDALKKYLEGEGICGVEVWNDNIEKEV